MPCARCRKLRKSARWHAFRVTHRCYLRRLNPAFNDMTKTALITGVTGQDGAYLAELLLQKGY